MDRNTLIKQANEIAPEIVAHRRTLHKNPEVGFALTKTRNYVKNQLEKMGYSVSTCGKIGLVTTVGHGSCVFLLRADMDALPIREESEVTFRSENGNMHACGHDMHTSMLLGAAKLLKLHESELSGTVKLMFQGAEEIFEGSRDMIEHGVLQSPNVSVAMMIHVMAGLPIPSGTAIISAPGVSAPAADYFKITVRGKGCHGSAPQNGVDAITVGSHILIALQEIQARELNASDEVVLTIGSFHAGSADNVISDEAILGGTIRTYDETTRNFIKERVTAISEGIASAFRANAVVTFGSGCPVLQNDEHLSLRTREYLRELLGEKSALVTSELGSDGAARRGGGSEDFAYISREVPSLMIALAAGEPLNGYKFPQHHPKVMFDERVLPIGSAIYAWTAIRYLQEHSN